MFTQFIWPCETNFWAKFCFLSLRWLIAYICYICCRSGQDSVYFRLSSFCDYVKNFSKFNFIYRLYIPMVLNKVNFAWLVSVPLVSLSPKNAECWLRSQKPCILLPTPLVISLWPWRWLLTHSMSFYSSLFFCLFSSQSLWRRNEKNWGMVKKM